MSMAYIRKTYRVPAKRGGRVEYTGSKPPVQGNIVSAKYGLLNIKMDDTGATCSFHPTWKLRYLPAAPKPPRA